MENMLKCLICRQRNTREHKFVVHGMINTVERRYTYEDLFAFEINKQWESYYRTELWIEMLGKDELGIYVNSK